jgi:hypothetical protein
MIFIMHSFRHSHLTSPYHSDSTFMNANINPFRVQVGVNGVCNLYSETGKFAFRYLTNVLSKLFFRVCFGTNATF